MIFKKSTFVRWALICLILFPVSSVFAGAGISLGATSSYNYDSNVFRSSTTVKSAQYYQVNPRAVATLNISKISFSAGYSGGFSFYPSSPQNDYRDLTGFGSLSWKANDLYGFGINGSYSNSHLPRESIETTVSPNDPLEFVELINLSAKALFPLYKERYDVQLGASARDSRYSGLDADEKNKKTGLAKAELQYRHSGKTSLVYGYKVNLNDLKSDLYNNLDGISQALYVGARWLTTGKTSSHALIGYEILRLNGSETGSYGGLNIDVSAIWQRKSYSKVKLSMSRSSSDSLFYGTGFLINNQLGLELSHELTGHWSVGAGTNIFAYQSYAEYRHFGGGMTFNARYSTGWISVGVRSGYQFRHSLEKNNTGYSGYTVAAELAITI